MKKPFFSVYIPTRNRVELLQQAIETVFQQTFSDYEIIVEDNHSTDGTQAYCKELARMGRIRYYRNPKDLGFVKNIQLSGKRAKGKFLFLLGDDDLLVPSCLEEYVKILKDKKKNVGMCRCGTYRFIGRRQNGFMVDTFPDTLLKYAPENYAKILTYNATFLSGWAIINEKPMVFGNGHQDVFIETVYAKLKKYNFYFIGKPLIAARCHTNLGYSFYSFTSSWFELDKLVKKYVPPKYLNEAIVSVKYHMINDCQNIKIYGGIPALDKHLEWYYADPVPETNRERLFLKSNFLKIMPNTLILFLKNIYFYGLLFASSGKYEKYWH